MESLDRLISRLNRLPGIGIKTAQRLAYHIISLPDEDAAALANSIEDAHRLVHFCPICGNYTENEVCEICSDPKRSSDTLCVVKDARDVILWSVCVNITEGTTFSAAFSPQWTE